MQYRTIKTKVGWPDPGDTLERSCHESRCRSRDRHVGDVRFAIFMLVIFAIACGLTFRSEAAPMRPAHRTAIDSSSCAQGSGADVLSEVNLRGADARLRANAVLLGPDYARPPVMTWWRPVGRVCPTLPSATLPRVI
jgi:hypothetical protein